MASSRSFFGGITAAALASIPAIIRYNTGSSSYPARSTVTTDVTRTVFWYGPSAPAVGGSGSVDGVDTWFRTP